MKYNLVGQFPVGHETGLHGESCGVGKTKVSLRSHYLWVEDSQEGLLVPEKPAGAGMKQNASKGKHTLRFGPTLLFPRMNPE